VGGVLVFLAGWLIGLIDGNVAIGFAFPIEPAEARTLERANGRECARRKVFGNGKFGEPGQDLVTFGKYHGVGLFTVAIFRDEAGLQAGSPPPLRDRTRPREAFQRRQVRRLRRAGPTCGEKTTGGQAGTNPLTT
jgi:hypothetical protein